MTLRLRHRLDGSAESLQKLAGFVFVSESEVGQVACGSFPGTKPVSSQAAWQMKKRSRYRSDAMRQRRLFSDNVQRKPPISCELVEHVRKCVFGVPPQEVHVLKIPLPVLQIMGGVRHVLPVRERPQSRQRWKIVTFGRR